MSSISVAVGARASSLVASAVGKYCKRSTSGAADPVEVEEEDPRRRRDAAEEARWTADSKASDCKDWTHSLGVVPKDRVARVQQRCSRNQGAAGRAAAR